MLSYMLPPTSQKFFANLGLFGWALSTILYRGRQGNLTTYREGEDRAQRDLKTLALKTAATARNASSYQNWKEARDRFSPRAFRERTILLTP